MRNNKETLRAKMKLKVKLMPDQIRNLIYSIRGEQVMLDRDLAILYGVQTGRLNEAVKRNIDRFPTKFMFQLTQTELNEWMSQIAISNKEKMGIRKMPYAFIEQGIAMLSAVLRSKKAITISIQIMNAFVAMRKFIGSNAKLFIARLELVVRRRSRTDLRIAEISSLTQRSLVAFKSSLIFAPPATFENNSYSRQVNLTRMV